MGEKAKIITELLRDLGVSYDWMIEVHNVRKPHRKTSNGALDWENKCLKAKVFDLLYEGK